MRAIAPRPPMPMPPPIPPPCSPAPILMARISADAAVDSRQSAVGPEMRRAGFSLRKVPWNLSVLRGKLLSPRIGREVGSEGRWVGAASSSHRLFGDGLVDGTQGA